MRIAKASYCIPGQYHARAQAGAYDDTAMHDEYQREVYVHAQKLTQSNNWKSVIDVGCGSAYKLITLLGSYDTLGLDISPTYEWLVKQYPDRQWMKSDFSTSVSLKADLVICSDVIEHVLDPDQLLSFINRINCNTIIISTVARELLYDWRSDAFWGPPKNQTHIREWTCAEFKEYLSQWFDGIEQAITNSQQATQMIICRKKHS
jgi:SAM-dependent methyltransferase